MIDRCRSNEVRRSHQSQGPGGQILNLGMLLSAKCTVRINPELHYMPGPGPKWRAKHQPWLRFNSEAVPPAGQHQLSPVYVRRRDAANPTR